jgi:O-antigen/teichoic acid export membrane protein
MLWVRLIGAAATLVICIPMIRSHGVFGAAAGSLMALAIYVVLLWFGPWGCWWMIREARRKAAS